MNSFRSNQRSAFTLVELLVVIVIIGILIALLVPTIGSAIARAKVAAMGLEVSNLAKAVESYKMEMGEYPPDFAGLDGTQAKPEVGTDYYVVRNHLARKYRFRNATAAPPAGDNVTLVNLDPAEALVFWLSGLSSDPKFPLARREAFALTGVALKGDKPFFEFDESRLMDKDGDGWPEYYAANSEAPYVYIRNDNYGVLADPATPNVFTPNAIPVMNGLATLKAYAAETLGNNVSRFAEPEKFQIICAGLDGEFNAGPTAPVGRYPDGIGYADADRDNITNFSEGNTLEDAIP